MATGFITVPKPAKDTIDPPPSMSETFVVYHKYSRARIRNSPI